MERALRNWRSIKDRETGPELSRSLDICESAMMEAEEAFEQYVWQSQKDASKKITCITKPLLSTIPKRMPEEVIGVSKIPSIKKTVMPLKPTSKKRATNQSICVDKRLVNGRLVRSM